MPGASFPVRFGLGSQTEEFFDNFGVEKEPHARD